MKSQIKWYLLLLLAQCMGFAAAAQTTAASLGCKDATILTQASELQNNLVNQGFEVLNNAMLSMDSRTELPIVVRMKQGEFYQVVFVGNTRSNRINLDLFHQKRKLVLHKEQRPMKQTSNAISFSFSPEETDDYTFTLSQVIKSGSTCGSFTILRLKSDKKQ